MPKNQTKTAKNKLQPETILRVEGLDILYGDFQALGNINLQLQQGQALGVIGINGAGKTSLIKAILGFRTQSKGTISLFDHSHLDGEIKKKVAYLPEKFEPSWFMNGEEFMRFSNALYHKQYDRNKAFEYADLLYLDREALKKPTATYSKGMKQKLGLLSVALSGAEFMILDEPMSGLDPLVRKQLKKLLKQIHAEGRTLLISSHVLEDLEEICDEIAVIHNHELRALDTPAALMKQTKARTLEQGFLRIIGQGEEAA